MTPGARATKTVACFALPPAVIVALIVGLTAGAVPGVVVFVVLGAGLWWWAGSGGDGVVARHLNGRDADPREDARLCNLVEGLAAGAGVHPPRMVVVETAGLNALVAGTDSRKAVLAVTTGLLEDLTRMELEAVLAEELYLLRHDETRPATVLVATFGLGRKLALVGDRDSAADRGAVSLTRYPPALASALEKISSKGSAVPGQPRYLAHLWLADPASPGAPAEGGRLPLEERVEALREL